MKAWVVALCCVALSTSFPAEAQKYKKKAAKKRVKIERLACRVGPEDEHARIAVQLANGKVDSFAYYSKWKPQTCSMDVSRGDAFSSWEDTGNRTVVTLVDDTGAFLIEHAPGRYHFIFRDIDRMRYCGMEGKVSGSLTIFRGQPQCLLEGVMTKDGSELVEQPPVERALAGAEPEPDLAEVEELEIAEMGVGGTTEAPAVEIHVSAVPRGAGQVARAPDAPAGASIPR